MANETEERVLQLATDVIDSFEKLELLIAVASATEPVAPARLLTLAGLDRAAASEDLAELVRRQLLAESPAGYTLVAGPWSPHVAALLSLHRADRMRVVALMSQGSLARLRSQALRAFADAFILGKKKGDE